MTNSQRVRRILELNPSYNSIDARSSDKVLLMFVWNMLGFGMSEGQKYKFMHLPIPESIRRERQRFNEKGLFLPSQKIQKGRKFKSQVIEQNAPTAKPEYIGQLVEQTRII